MKFLDDRPINADERRCAEAWFKGGAEAEKDERFIIYEEKKRKNERIVEDAEDT